MKVPPTSLMLRTALLVVTTAVALMAMESWTSGKFPVMFSLAVCAWLLAGMMVYRARQERLEAERRAYEATSARLREFARHNAELSRELSESRQLEEQTNLQVRAFDALLQGVIITDPHKPGNPIIYANERFSALTGYETGETIGRGTSFLHGKDTSPMAVASLGDAFRSAKSCLVETLSYRKDGTTFWNALSVAPIIDEGRLTHYVLMLTDISVFKKLEEQLRQSQKMDAVGQLAGGVAHDFNNLLTVINGCCELLQAGGDVSQEGVPLVEEIHKAGERAANLTTQLLAFSRKTVLQPRILCMNEVVENLVRMLERLIGENIRLSTNLFPELGSVRVDPGQIEQVLTNLVVNARDAMPNGGEIQIETREVYLDAEHARNKPKLRPGSYIRISVRDSGKGMDKATMDRLFEPFFTTKPVGKGTGLGLAMAYGILEASSGHIEVTSKPGEGTTFLLYLPVCENQTRIVESPSKILNIGGTETILVVEDEDGVRSLTAQSLRARGYRVLHASNGIEALRVAANYSGTIHLMVTDVVMPGMSGSELRAKMMLDHPKLRVIFMSGYTNDAILRSGVIEQECNFLQKPFTLSTLSEKVRATLDREADVTREMSSMLEETVA